MFPIYDETVPGQEMGAALEKIDIQGSALSAIGDVIADSVGEALAFQQTGLNKVGAAIRRWVCARVKQQGQSLVGILDSLISTIMQRIAEQQVKLNIVAGRLPIESLGPGVTAFGSPRPPGVIGTLPVAPSGPVDLLQPIGPQQLPRPPFPAPGLQPNVPVKPVPGIRPQNLPVVPVIPVPPVQPSGVGTLPVQPPSVLQPLPPQSGQNPQPAPSPTPYPPAPPIPGNLPLDPALVGDMCADIPEEAKASQHVVYIKPWGAAKGGQASTESECGKKLIEEAMAKWLPVQDMLDAMQHDDWPNYYLPNDSGFPLM